MRARVLALWCTSLVLGAGCQTERIRAVSSVVPAGLSIAQVEAAIEAGAARREWIITEAAPGTRVARIYVRGKHMAEVGIRYDLRRYRIEYRNSENLDARGDRVHQNYFRWVANLDRAIRIELLRAASPVQAPSSPDD
jgi:hypothetical protein